MNASAGTWISATEMAALAGISMRKARCALARANAGQKWRGHSLAVVAQRGQGGASGFSYLVRIDSLPPDLRERAEALFGSESEADEALPAPLIAASPLVPLAVTTSAAGSRWEWAMDIIRPALAVPKGTRERAEVIAELARRSFSLPGGDRRQFGESTIYDWISRYERHGLAGLERKGRSDRGQSRVLITREWDRGVPFSQAVKQRIARKLTAYVKSVWATAGGGKGAGAAKTGGGWTIACRLATKELIKMTRRAGLDASTPQLLALCSVPRCFVEHHRDFAIIALKANDAKAFADLAAPRTRRTRAGMVPMELVVGDVHHVDIYLRRGDGSLFTPKIIAWSDIATNRMFITLVFVEKGKGVRQEDVIASFIEMTQHPEWGMPQALYLDNGGEFSKLGFVNDAMKLCTLPDQRGFRVGLVADDPDVGALVKRATTARRKAIINAQPYNAPAKPIEGLFAVLEGGALAMLPGWIGGNRMKAKTKNVGKEPTPFEGTEDEFRAVFATGMDYYDTNTQRGSLAGKSPRAAFAAAVADGWKRTDVDPHALHAVFAKEETREVMQGEFTYKNVAYRAQELLTLLPGTKVVIKVPLVGDKSRIAVLNEEGVYLCTAEPAPRYGFLDPAGAEDRGQRTSAQNKAIRAMATEVETLDLVDEMREAVGLHPPAPVPASGGTIRLSDQAQDIAQAAKRLPADRAANNDAQLQAHRAQGEALRQFAAAVGG
ncbi:MAG: helix-turn-helix domain-containing protein [Alphaproteobacteria bacterium]|nr:helix-turn-helix domain-containing protein [Alphaproteobacteria bacterium]